MTTTSWHIEAFMICLGFLSYINMHMYTCPCIYTQIQGVTVNVCVRVCVRKCTWTVSTIVGQDPFVTFPSIYPLRILFFFF